MSGQARRGAKTHLYLVWQMKERTCGNVIKCSKQILSLTRIDFVQRTSAKTHLYLLLAEEVENLRKHYKTHKTNSVSHQDPEEQTSSMTDFYLFWQMKKRTCESVIKCTKQIQSLTRIVLNWLAW
jgi:hypothetical protein